MSGLAGSSMIRPVTGYEITASVSGIIVRRW
jgi:hypothetical protein